MKNSKNIFATIITLATLAFNASGQEIAVEICGNTSLLNDNDVTWHPIGNNEYDIETTCNKIILYYAWGVYDGESVAINKFAGDTLIVDNTTKVLLKKSSNEFIKIVFNNTTASVDENRSEDVELLGFPNPCVDNITVRFETNKTNMPISVFSLSGQLVYRNTDSRYIGRNEFNIPTSNLAQGMYLLQVGTATEYFVVE